MHCSNFQQVRQLVVRKGMYTSKIRALWAETCIHLTMFTSYFYLRKYYKTKDIYK